MNVSEKLCDHCEGVLTGHAYRVISKDQGVTLLDMIVCHACSLVAQKLGLKTQQLDSVKRQFLDGG